MLAFVVGLDRAAGSRIEIKPLQKRFRVEDKNRNVKPGESVVLLTRDKDGSPPLGWNQLLWSGSALRDFYFPPADPRKRDGEKWKHLMAPIFKSRRHPKWSLDRPSRMAHGMPVNKRSFEKIMKSQFGFDSEA